MYGMKAECDEYKLLRKNKLFCLLSEKPTRGVIYLPFMKIEYPWCKNKFFSKTNAKFCSVSCNSQNGGALRKGKPGKNKGHIPWNKGIPNPTAAEQGKRTAAKQSLLRVVKGDSHRWYSVLGLS